MKTTIEITIKVPVEFEYESAEEQTFHEPGWPASASWISYDEKAVMAQIEAELDKSEDQLIEIVEQEMRELAGEAAYEERMEMREEI